MLKNLDKAPGADSKWQKLIDWYAMVHELRAEGEDIDIPVLFITNLFIDDTPGVGIKGVGRAILSAFAALVEVLKIDVNFTKVLADGSFSNK
jgi:hypothetical protein